MRENLSVPGRLAVRTPMQWNRGKNGGFSDAARKDLVRPMDVDASQETNVAIQRADRDSLMNWMAALICTRKECPEVGWGERSVIAAHAPSVFAMRYEYDGGIVVILHNLSSKAVDCELSIRSSDVVRLLDMFGDQDYDPIDPEDPKVHLEGYGYRWLRSGDVGHV